MLSMLKTDASGSPLLHHSSMTHLNQSSSNFKEKKVDRTSPYQEGEQTIEMTNPNIKQYGVKTSS